MRALYFIFLAIFTLGCTTVSKLQKKGSVIPEEFRESIPFTTYKSVIVLPVETNEGTKNFLFDTGAQLNLIQSTTSDEKKTATVEGASNRKMELQQISVSSLKFGQVAFINTVSLAGDFDGLKQQIPNFGGAIGQSVMSKANWKIDYPNKILELSTQPLSDASFQSIAVERENGSPHVLLTIDGTAYKCLVDLGASTPGVSIPEEHPLAKELLSKHNFQDSIRETYSIGGLQQVNEKVGTLEKVQLGTVDFKEVPVVIRKSSQLRVGMNFFKDCILVIDNLNKDYKVKKSR